AWPPALDDEAGNQFALRQRRLDLRRTAGRLVQLLERKVTGAGPAGDLDRGIERNQRLREVAGIGGDALIRGAENGMGAAEPIHGGAARAGIPLVAGLIADVAEI